MLQTRWSMEAWPQVTAVARAEREVTDTDARLWNPWLRINRVFRVILHTRWSAEAWPQVKAEFTKASRFGARSGARGGSTSRRSRAGLLQVVEDAVHTILAGGRFEKGARFHAEEEV